MEDLSGPPRVIKLRGIDSFDAWEASLRANLEYHGVLGFVELGSSDDKDKTKKRNKKGSERRPRRTGSHAFAQ